MIFTMNLIVINAGYVNLDKVKKLLVEGKQFSIYRTKKETNILVMDATEDNITLYLPDRSRLEWKTTEGKKIISGTKIYDSRVKVELPDVKEWNNGNQIISYKHFI